jgi:hypothetical protein
VSFVNVHTMVLENPRVSSLEVGGGRGGRDLHKFDL